MTSPNSRPDPGRPSTGPEARRSAGGRRARTIGERGADRPILAALAAVLAASCAAFPASAAPSWQAAD
ncbi:MAG: hypothetical protein M3P37_01280, partial [Actinomycetota bacterium]|nr:hypothetical protein [Actinomycetota bacterium]